MFSFKWNETSYGRCVDEKENTYSYDAYYNIPSYEECAKTCLNKMDQLLLEDQQDGSGSFRGIDYICESRGSGNPHPDKYYVEGECHCLFDFIPSSHFDYTDRYHLGVGPVTATKVEWVIPDIDFEQTILCGAIVNRYNINEQGVTAVY
jgi:hypothetical protein